MSDEHPNQHDPDLTAEELEGQSADLLPDREAMSVIEDPLRGPMPLLEPESPGEQP
jgi:hypothetical protein